MSAQVDLFAGLAARDEGIRKVAENNEEFLDLARRTAVAICELRGCVTSDEVREAMPLVPKHPNAYGAIFKDKRFEWTGQFIQSTFQAKSSLSVISPRST